MSIYERTVFTAVWQWNDWFTGLVHHPTLFGGIHMNSNNVFVNVDANSKGAVEARLPPSTINLLPQATLSGNMHTIQNTNVNGTPEQIVWDLHTANFCKVTQTKNQYNWQGYFVNVVNTPHGVVSEEEAAWWMAEWPTHIDANLITLAGIYHYTPQPDAAWKIQLRQNGNWIEHARGVGGWYDGGRYIWGGPGTAAKNFDALRVSVFSKNANTSLTGIHFRGEEGFSWVVGQCAQIDAFIVPERRMLLAGRPELFVAESLGVRNITSWLWNFGDGNTANGANVSHTYANPGMYEVLLTVSDGNHTQTTCQNVKIGSPIDVQIVPLSGPAMVGQPIQLITQVAAGAPTFYHWDFGDGGTAEGTPVHHVFSKPGIHHVKVEASDGCASSHSLAIVRVHTPETVNVPQVFLDSDMGNEADDQHYFAYALFSELDVLGVSSVHAGWENEPYMNEEIHRVLDLAKLSGLPADRVPGTYSGANRPLVQARTWDKTEPKMTDASEAILAAARGASPGNPVWIVPVGPCTNIASAILQAKDEGLDLVGRIRIMWLGGGYDAADLSWNGMRDPCALNVIGQSGIETWILLEPVGDQLAVTMATESVLYPCNPLGDYLRGLMPDPQTAGYHKPRGLYDPTALAAIISQARGFNWYSQVKRVNMGIPNETYVRWDKNDTGTVHIIWEINPEAMKKDMFDTLNGNPTPLIDI